MSNDPFVNTPPTKPGWYWKQIEAFPYPIVYPVQAIVDDDTKCICDSAGEPLLETVGIQWDPTPILGPGELQGRLQECFQEAFDAGFECEERFASSWKEAWEDSSARSKLQAPEPQSTVTASAEGGA